MSVKRFCSVLSMLLVSIVALCSLTACSEVGLGPDELLSPPKPTGDMYPIQRALEKKVSGKIKLKYPTSGEYRSSFILTDLKGTGQKDYVLSFYSTGTETATVMHINLIQKVDNEWVSVSDSQFNAAGVEKVAFGDLDGDGVKEIVVGWNIYSNVDRQVAVYVLSGDKLVQRMQENYTDFICTDLNEDKKNELFVLTLNTAAKTSTAQIFTLAQNGIFEDGSCSLDGNVTSYSTPVLSRLTNNQPAVFIDAVKGNGMITEVVYLKGTVLTDAFYNVEKAQNIDTQRDTSVASFDINGDGKQDIPTLEILIGNQVGDSDRVYMTQWRSYSGSEFVATLYTIMNYIDGYYVILPDRWVGKTTVIKRTDSRLRIFYLLDKGSGKVTEELMRIRVMSQSEWDKNDSTYTGYIKLAESEGFVYVALISGYKGSEAISEQDLKEMFQLIK